LFGIGVASLDSVAVKGKSADKSATFSQSNLLRYLQKIEKVVADLAKSKDGKSVTVHFDPPELGRVRVEVSIRGGTLHAKLSPELSDIANLLREKSLELQSSIRALDLPVQNVQVSVSTDRSSEDESLKRDLSHQQQSLNSSFSGDNSQSSSNGGQRSFSEGFKDSKSRQEERDLEVSILSAGLNSKSPDASGQAVGIRSGKTQIARDYWIA